MWLSERWQLQVHVRHHPWPTHSHILLKSQNSAGKAVLSLERACNPPGIKAQRAAGGKVLSWSSSCTQSQQVCPHPLLWSGATPLPLRTLVLCPAAPNRLRGLSLHWEDWEELGLSKRSWIKIPTKSTTNIIRKSYFWGPQNLHCFTQFLRGHVAFWCPLFSWHPGITSCPFQEHQLPSNCPSKRPWKVPHLALGLAWGWAWLVADSKGTGGTLLCG